MKTVITCNLLGLVRYSYLAPLILWFLEILNVIINNEYWIACPHAFRILILWEIRNEFKIGVALISDPALGKDHS